MALRAGYYGIKRGLKAKLAEIAGAWDTTIASLFPRDEQAVLGALNMLPRYHDTDTINGVTYTVGSDDVITLSDTATAYSDFTFVTRGSKLLKLPIGTWKIIPRKTGSDDSNINIGSGNTGDGTTGTFESWANSSGEPVTFIVDSVRSNRYISVSINIANGKTADSTWQPMIVPVTTPDDTPYVPHAMTNRELTLSAQDQKTTINAIITAATGAADFAAFKAAMEAITPVTRSLSKELSPEDVPEEVIEEKPVTKKTSKKTVKEGE